MAKRFKRLSRKLIPFIIVGLAVLATVTAASFSLLHPQAVSAQQVSRRDGYVSIGLPSTGNQDDNWSCGPNSAARVLAFYGHNVDYNTVRSAVNQEFILPPSVNVPAPTLTDWTRTRRVDIRTGTTPHVLRDVMKQWEGNNVRLERGTNFSTLVNLLREGKPIVALLRVGSIPPETTLSGTWPMMHWVAVDGFNESDRLIYYTDTDGGRYQLSYDEFQGQWDWRVGRGFASEALHRNGVQAKTMIWVDRTPPLVSSSSQGARDIAQFWPGMFSSDIDAAVEKSGIVYFFKGSQYTAWNVANGTLEHGPRDIARFWPGIFSSDIDAAVEKSGIIYFFKGSEYTAWDIGRGQAEPGGPKSIARFWPGMFSSDIDAAVEKSGIVYFFKGSEYTAWDVSRGQAESGGSKSISRFWPGIFSSDIDATVEKSGIIYFFKGSQYTEWSE